MTRCDDCGAEVSDAIGSRQCDLFGPADPRIDPHAAESLKAGRILCPACARGVPLEPLDTPAAVAIDLADGEADAADDGDTTGTVPAARRRGVPRPRGARLTAREDGGR